MALTIDQLNIQITADSKAAAAALDGLTGRFRTLNNTLKTFNTAGTKIKGAFQKTTTAANNAAKGVNTYNTSANKASKTTQNFSDALTRKISKWRTLFGAFKSAANMMAGWFNESNDYIETLNLFNVTMGEGADKAYAYAESVQKLIGIDIAEWMNYQGTFKQLTSGFGVASDAANVMSQNLTQLSYDMASFFNTDVETAFDKLSSAMSGQVKGLREFGIDTTVASLQEYALSKGIDASVRSMTQAEKSLLRYNYIMEKSIIIQGDMARTLVTPANSIRILKAQFTQLKRALGNIVSVIVVRFIPYVQAMVEILTEAANAIAKFFNFELPEIDYSGLGGNMSENFEDSEESLDGVSGTLKKIKKQLMGFDELNVINNPESESGEGEDAGSGALGNMDLLEYNFLKNLNTGKLDEIKQKMKDILGYFPAIAAGFATWKITRLLTDLLLANARVSALTKTGIVVGITLAVIGLVWNIKANKDAWENGLEIPNFSEILGSAGLTVGGSALAGASIGKIFGAAMSGSIWGAAIAAIPIGIGMFITGIRDAIIEGLNWLNGVLIPVGSTLAATGIGTIIGVCVGSIGGPLGALVGALIGLAVGLLTDLGILIYQKWDEICAFFAPAWEWIYSNILEPIVNFFAGAATWFNNNVIQPIIAFFTPIVEAIVYMVKLIYEKVKEIVVGIINAVVSIFTKVKEIFLKIVEIFVALGKAAYEYIIKPIVEFVVDFATTVYNKAIKPIFNFFAELGKKAYESVIKPIFDKVVWLKDKAVELFKSVGTYVVNFVSNAFKAVINGVLSGIEWVINGFIKLLNGAIDLINLIPGVNITHVQLLNIPRLAEGGIVSEGQMFIAREAGPELVGQIGNKTAVANNDQIVSGIEAGVYRAMMAANTGGNKNVTVNATIEMDGEVVGRKVIKYHNGIVMQTGESPLLV